MDDPVATHHAIGYLCLILGIAALLTIPSAFVLGVDDYFRRLEEEHRLDYALTPEFLRKSWYFALKDNLFKSFWIIRITMFGLCYLIVIAILIYSGIMMIGES